MRRPVRLSARQAPGAQRLPLPAVRIVWAPAPARLLPAALQLVWVPRAAGSCRRLERSLVWQPLSTPSPRCSRVSALSWQAIRCCVQVLSIVSNLFLQLPFSRRAEAEADLIGVKLMGLAGYDPQVSLVLLAGAVLVATPQGRDRCKPTTEGTTCDAMPSVPASPACHPPVCTARKAAEPGQCQARRGLPSGPPGRPAAHTPRRGPGTAVSSRPPGAQGAPETFRRLGQAEGKMRAAMGGKLGALQCTHPRSETRVQMLEEELQLMQEAGDSGRHRVLHSIPLWMLGFVASLVVPGLQGLQGQA